MRGSRVEKSRVEKSRVEKSRVERRSISLPVSAVEAVLGAKRTTRRLRAAKSPCWPTPPRMAASAWSSWQSIYPRLAQGRSR